MTCGAQNRRGCPTTSFIWWRRPVGQICGAGCIGFWLPRCEKSVLENYRDQKKQDPDESGIPAKDGTKQTVTASGGEKIADSAPEIQMRADDREGTAVVGNARQQDRCGKKGNVSRKFVVAWSTRFARPRSGGTFSSRLPAVQRQPRCQLMRCELAIRWMMPSTILATRSRNSIVIGG